MTDLAAAIKSAISMPEAARMYGFEPNRGGFIKCPFHGSGSERTASMKLYPGERGFHCFGCHAGGSVIDFAMLLFNLSFRAAVARLNADFGLGLTEDKPNPEALAQRRRERQERDRQRAKHDAMYRAKCDEYRRLWAAYRDKAPEADPNNMEAMSAALDAVDPEYIEACHKLDALEWWLEMNP
jgi:hypothetical protein